MAVTKKDIVMQIATETGIKQIYVKKIVQKALDHITKSLVKGETVELRNFGIFKVKSRKGRTGRNPRTGQEVPVPPKKVAIFKPGLVMKRDIR
jgi:DNA-binding protein HU-beta/integration host factor subunit alpha